MNAFWQKSAQLRVLLLRLNRVRTLALRLDDSGMTGQAAALSAAAWVQSAPGGKGLVGVHAGLDLSCILGSPPH
jgi:hypothetical protein